MIAFLKNFRLVTRPFVSNLQTVRGPDVIRLGRHATALALALVTATVVCNQVSAQEPTDLPGLHGQGPVSANAGDFQQPSLTAPQERPSIHKAERVETLAVAITPDPSSPEIGQQVLFSLSNLSGSVKDAQWSFGGAGCSGFTETATCAAGLFNDCKAMAYKYASGGDKSVAVTVHWEGGGSASASTSLTIQYTGTCGGGTTCSYAISPLNASFDSGGGSGTVTVNAQGGCIWTAVSNNSSWITVTAGATGSGSGQVGYSVGVNSGWARNGTMRIAGKTFTVNQAGLGCSYQLHRPPRASPLSAAPAPSVSARPPAAHGRQPRLEVGSRSPATPPALAVAPFRSAWR